MRIAMVTTYRYPTEKAYGVTIAHTCKALTKLGVDFIHFVPNLNSGFDQLGSKYVGVGSNSNSAKLKIPLRIAHHLGQLAVSRRVFLSLRGDKGFDLIWTRSPHLVLLLKILRVSTPTLLEIHDSRLFLDRLCLRILANSSTSFFGTISRSGLRSLSEISDSQRLFLLQMAAPDDFFTLQAHQSGLNLVGFAGKGVTNGQSNNLEMLIDALKIGKRRGIEFSLQFVGIEEKVGKELSRRIANDSELSSQLNVVKQLSHKELLGCLGNFDIGVIPYTDTPFNRERFPLKLVELAAARIPIMLSDIPSHRELIDESCVTFFQPDSSNFLEKLEKMRRDPKAVVQKVSLAFKWAQDYTYENRVQQVLNRVDLA